jgi:outer membrane lipase/esterase
MKRLSALWLALALVGVHGVGGAAAYSDLYIFGDSLSDAGNNFAAFGGTSIPQAAITGNTFVPDGPPYASGHYTNADIWATPFASMVNLPAPTASLTGGHDYAFGGARTSTLNPPPVGTAPGLNVQVDTFLAAHSTAPGGALYVVAGGGNNARDAAAAIRAGANPATTTSEAALGYTTDIVTIVGKLEAAGAQHIVVANVPDIGQTPFAQSFGAIPAAGASLLASSMNGVLAATLQGDPHVKIFNLFGAVDAVVANPAGFGLTNVTDACGQFTDCDPSKYLFWDGIHPTSAGHELIAEALFQTIVPEPSVFVLVAAGVLLIASMRARSLRWARMSTPP